MRKLVVPHLKINAETFIMNLTKLNCLCQNNVHFEMFGLLYINGLIKSLEVNKDKKTCFMKVIYISNNKIIKLSAPSSITDEF